MDSNRLHVLLTPTPEGVWLAHILELDQATQAPTADEAVALLTALVDTLREHLRKVGKPDAIWLRAPESEWRRFDRAFKAGDTVKLTTPLSLPGGKGQVEEVVVGRLE